MLLLFVLLLFSVCCYCCGSLAAVELFVVLFLCVFAVCGVAVYCCLLTFAVVVVAWCLLFVGC